MARREKKPVHHVQMTDGKRAIIQQLLQEYGKRQTSRLGVDLYLNLTQDLRVNLIHPEDNE
jgi:hypothetical protein